eukprot:g3149.t1 g3149   contig12:1513564-1518213(-)
MLDGVVAVTVNGVTATCDEHVFKSNPKWANHLRTWGEAGVVKGDRGKTMMFVGYAADRESDSFRMWDSDTNRVVVTRDVIFLKRMFFERPVHESTYLMDEMDSDEDESEAGRVDDDDAIATRQSRVGRVCRTPEWLKDCETKLVNSEPGTFAKMGYLCLLAECHNDELFTVIKAYNDMEKMLIGAGVGGGFSNTNELKVMNYKQAMASEDADEWNDEIGNEHKRFKKFNAVAVVKRKDLPKGAKVEGMHFFGDSIAAPVTNPNTIRFCLVLLACMPLWISRILDVEGAFLQGQFVNGEVIYIGVPDGMEKYYGSRDDVVLLLNVPLYGTNQAANCFYTSLRKSASKRNYKRSRADPCLYYIWTDGRLALFATWVDDIIVFGHPQDVDAIEKNLKEAFVCKSEGELKEYVGSKIDVMRKSNGLVAIKITQPVLIQKLEDEFDVSTGKAPGTPARPGEVLSKLHGGELLTSAAATNYRSGTATLMFIMQWSRPDIFNATRGCARHMSAPGTVHDDALYWLIQYVISTRNRGLVMEPDRVWDGSSKFKFRIGGRADSNYAANEDDRRSVSGGRLRLEGCPVTFRSATQRFVTLSVTEAEGAAGNMVAQDMMYLYRSLTEIGLSVELPMVLEMDNSGAVDLANSYSVGGRTRHVDVRLYYLRELKEEGLLVIKHIPGENNDADIFTKNTDARTFERHIPSFVGKDEYMVEVPTPSPLFASMPPVTFMDLPNVTASPSTVAAVTDAPTVKPTFAATTWAPSVSAAPTAVPSISSSPSTSAAPSAHPSVTPTNSPTVSAAPTISSAPSAFPSSSPTYAPSASPSLGVGISYSKTYYQRIMVSKSEIFTVEEASFLQYLYERYTINFGYNVSTPQINTICLIAQQSVGSEPVIRNVERLFGSRQLHLLWSWNDRNLQTATVVSYPLSIYFRMEYNTRFEEYNNISEYNSFFMDYVNSNTTKVTEDMQRIGLPVINVEQMIMFTSPTPNPTFEPSTLAPNTPAPVTTAPFLLPTSNPSEEPTSPPSAAPFVDISGDSFILGISLGLSGFFVAAVVVYMYRRHRERTLSEMQARSKRPAVSEHHNDQQSDLGFDGSSMGIELTYPESTEFDETQQPGHIMPSDQDNDMVRITPATSQTNATTTVAIV